LPFCFIILIKSPYFWRIFEKQIIVLFIKSSEFSNGLILQKGETNGGLTDEVIKYQIERTIISHFENVKKLIPLKIKVLSLFFIDKCSNFAKIKNKR